MNTVNAVDAENALNAASLHAAEESIPIIELPRRLVETHP